MKRDVLVIGAGVLGLSSAYHIKRTNPKLNVTLIDQFSGPAQGNTAKCAGGYRNMLTTDTNIKLAESTIKWFRELQENKGFNTKGVPKDNIRRGEIVGHPSDLPTVAKAFTGRIFIINHPTAVGEGYTPVLHLHTVQIAVRFDKLISKLDPRTGQTVEENPAYLRTGEAAMVRLVPLQPTAMETFKDYPGLGRFALRDMGTTIGAGVVVEIEE